MPDLGRVLLIFTCLTLAACGFWGANNTVAPVMPMSNVASKTGDWFCQPNAAGDGWHCVQTARSVLDPIPSQPTRVPPPEPAPTSTDSPVNAMEALRLDPLQVPTDLTGANSTTAEALTAAPVVPNDERAEPAAVADAVRSDVASAKANVPAGTLPSRRKLVPEPDPSEAKQPDWQRLAYRQAIPVAVGALPAHFYAVQIVAMSSRAGLESFSNKHGLNPAASVRIETDGRLYHVLLLGIYETLADATAAVTSRPASLRTMQPWIRRLGPLQQAVARAKNRGQIPVSSNISEN